MLKYYSKTLLVKKMQTELMKFVGQYFNFVIIVRYCSICPEYVMSIEDMGVPIELDNAFP